MLTINNDFWSKIFCSFSCLFRSSHNKCCCYCHVNANNGNSRMFSTFYSVSNIQIIFFYNFCFQIYCHIKTCEFCLMPLQIDRKTQTFVFYFLKMFSDSHWKSTEKFSFKNVHNAIAFRSFVRSFVSLFYVNRGVATKPPLY